MITSSDENIIKKLFNKSNVMKYWQRDFDNDNIGSLDVFNSVPLHIIEYNSKYIHIIFEETITAYTVEKDLLPNIKIHGEHAVIKSPHKKSLITKYLLSKSPYEIEKRISYVLYNRDTKNFEYSDSGQYTSELWETETYRII